MIDEQKGQYKNAPFGVCLYTVGRVLHILISFQCVLFNELQGNLTFLLHLLQKNPLKIFTRIILYVIIIMLCTYYPIGF